MTICLNFSKVLSHKSAQSCPTLCDSKDCSPPGSSGPWDFPGKTIGVGCHFILQGIFPTQGSNSHFLHWQADSLPLSQEGNPSRVSYRGHIRLANLVGFSTKMIFTILQTHPLQIIDVSQMTNRSR